MGRVVVRPAGSVVGSCFVGNDVGREVRIAVGFVVGRDVSLTAGLVVGSGVNGEVGVDVGSANGREDIFSV